MPSRKERTEVETLKQQLLDMQDAAKQKEVRLMLSQDRMKRRADSLAKRNAELLEEVKVLEQDRALYVEKLSSLRVRFIRLFIIRPRPINPTHRRDLFQ